MVIAYLLGGFQGNGGIGRVTSVLVNNLVKDENIEVHTISFLQKDTPDLYSLDKGIKKHYLYKETVSMTEAMLLKHAIKKLKKILIENRVDILVCCGALFFPLGIYACKRLPVKCICWEHTNPLANTDYRFQNLCRKVAVKKADMMVVLTKSAERYYLGRYPKVKHKIAQIYNPVDFKKNEFVEYNAESKKIISVGRLSYPKNFERLISIAAVVLPKYPEWSWDIYGEGEQRGILQKLIDDNGLHDRLSLRGQVNNLYDRYKDYAFIVMTSRYEGFPMALLEGAGNGLPLVSFDIQTGPNEIIVDGKNGFLVEPSRDEDMVDRICDLIDNVKLRVEMSVEVNKIKDKFDTEEIKLEWKRLFADILKKTKA